MILIMSKRKLAMKILNFVLIIAVLTVGLSLIMGLKGVYGAGSPIPSFAMEPDSINFEDKNPQVYAPEFSDEYEFDIEMLNYFSEELHKRFNEEPRRAKLLFVYIENNVVTRLSKFVPWVISKKSEIGDTLRNTGKGRYCVYYFGYAPELSYALIGWEEFKKGACSDYGKITLDFFNRNPVSFSSLSTPSKRDKAKQWLSALVEEVLETNKKGKDENSAKTTLCIDSSDRNHGTCILQGSACKGKIYEYESAEECAEYEAAYNSLNSIINNPGELGKEITIGKSPDNEDIYKIVFSDKIKPKFERGNEIMKYLLMNHVVIFNSENRYGTIIKLGKDYTFSIEQDPQFDQVYIPIVIEIKNDGLAKLLSSDKITITVMKNLEAITKGDEKNEENEASYQLCRLSDDTAQCREKCANQKEWIAEFDELSECNKLKEDWEKINTFIKEPEAMLQIKTKEAENGITLDIVWKNEEERTELFRTIKALNDNKKVLFSLFKDILVNSNVEETMKDVDEFSIFNGLSIKLDKQYSKLELSYLLNPVDETWKSLIGRDPVFVRINFDLSSIDFSSFSHGPENIFCLSEEKDVECIPARGECNGNSLELSSEEECSQVLMKFNSIKAIEDAIKKEASLIKMETPYVFRLRLLQDFEKRMAEITEFVSLSVEDTFEVYELEGKNQKKVGTLSFLNKDIYDFELPKSLFDADNALSFQFKISLKILDERISKILGKGQIELSIIREIPNINLKDKGKNLCRLEDGSIACLTECEGEIVGKFNEFSECEVYLKEWDKLKKYIDSPGEYYYFTQLEYHKGKPDSEDVFKRYDYIRAKLNMNEAMLDFISYLESGGRISFPTDFKVSWYKDGQIFSEQYIEETGGNIAKFYTDFFTDVVFLRYLKLKDPIFVKLAKHDIIEISFSKDLSEDLQVGKLPEWTPNYFRLCKNEDGDYICSYEDFNCMSSRIDKNYVDFITQESCLRTRENYYLIAKVVRDIGNMVSIEKKDGSDGKNKDTYKLIIEKSVLESIEKLKSKSDISFSLESAKIVKDGEVVETSQLKEDYEFEVSSNKDFDSVFIPYSINLASESWSTLFGSTEIKGEIEIIIIAQHDDNVVSRIKLAQPKKRESAYSSKGVFLISNKNWRDVMSLVPVSAWKAVDNSDSKWCHKGYNTPEQICIYPTLIYHYESNGIDADSIIYFIKQYQPDKITLIKEPINTEIAELLVADNEHGAGMPKENIETINPSDYIKYWESYDNVVYCEDNYSIALFASVYASHINAPFIVERSSLDKEAYLDGREVICVGKVDKKELCSKTYGLKELEAKYCGDTSCLKKIFVNPEDLFMSSTRFIQPEYSSGKIFNLFQKNSMLAPFLASAKEEVIYNIEGENFLEVSKKIKSAYQIDSRIEPVSCYLGESCSSGYDEFKDSSRIYVEDEFEFELPEELSKSLAESDQSTLEIGGQFLKCEESSVFVFLEADDEEVWSGIIPCGDEKSFMAMDQLSAPNSKKYIEIQLPEKREIERIKIRFEGASLFFFDAEHQTRDSFYVVRYKSSMQTNKQFYCDAKNQETCLKPFIKGNKAELKGGFSDNEESRKGHPIKFKLPLKDKVLLFKLEFVGGEGLSFDLFINGKDIVGKWEKTTPSELNSWSFTAESKNGYAEITIQPSFYQKWVGNPFSVNLKGLAIDKEFLSNSYLTIFGSDSLIKEKLFTHMSFGLNFFLALDPYEYAKLEIKSYSPLIPIGRIKGFTTSDVSSIIMRSLFYKEVLKNDNKVSVMATADPKDQHIYVTDRDLTKEFADSLKTSGFNVKQAIKNTRTYEFPPVLWENKQIILYSDHGSPSWAGIYYDEIPALDSSIVALIACSTCENEAPSSFCLNTIRKGAVSVIGTVGIAFAGIYTPFGAIQDMLNDGISMGHSFKKNYKSDKEALMYELLGDPTFRLTKTVPISKIEEFYAPPSGETAVLS